ncbi:MAG: MAPEG family protein [Hyphomicrobium sp.]|jgi:hypothetical protein
MGITAFYASLLAFLFLWLSVRVVAARREARVEIGVGESADLLRRARVHANFAEYVPIALILMALAESGKAPLPVVHVIGVVLVAGRAVHAYGLSQRTLKLRVAGMMLTFAAIAIGALACLASGALRILV